jgi:hypothetical protein
MNYLAKDKKEDKKEPKNELLKPEDVGKKGLFAMFDEPRPLRLNLDAMAWLENNVIMTRALAPDVIFSSLRFTHFFKPTLRACLGMVHGEPRFKPEDVERFYEAYIENTGNRNDLEQILIEVYELATKNPTQLKREREEKEKAAKEAEEAKAKEKTEGHSGME